MAEKQRGEEEHEEREELPFGEEADHRCVRLAELLAENPENRVKREKQAGDQARRCLGETHPHDPQNREKQRAFQQGLVNLRRMPRLEILPEDVRDLRVLAGGGDQRIERFRIRQRRLHAGAGLPRDRLGFIGLLDQRHRKLDRPRHAVRHPAVELAVDEIRHPPEEQPDRPDHTQAVGQTSPRDLVLFRVNPGEDRQSENPAMAGHPAFPHAQNQQRIMRQPIPPGFRDLIEKDVPQPPAQKHAEQRAGRDEVADFFRFHHPQAALRQIPQQQETRDETRQIGQSIPPQRQPAVNRQRHRIQIMHVCRKHGGSTHDPSPASKP